MGIVKVFRKDRPGEMQQVVVPGRKTRQNKTAFRIPSGMTKGGTRIPPAVNDVNPNQPS
jgi:hypothetical protein